MTRRRSAVLGGAVAATVAVLVLRIAGAVPLFSYTTEELRVAVAGYGALAPVVMMAFQAVQVVVAPVPNQPAAVAAGYLFGAWRGLLYTAIGTTVGGLAAFVLARTVGRPLRRWWFQKICSPGWTASCQEPVPRCL
ncbi:MAG: VTT domain-containing protein [Candidatus Nanohaloarchaea archaeon]|nr:VTT domain-containing protein [Candidatus Nanohaloarchaea archaeon]